LSRRDAAWLADILTAIDAADGYLARGSLDDGLVYDACRVRLIEIGEAVKHLDPELLGRAPDIRWRAIARMRDQLTHHYFDTDHAIVTQAMTEELPRLRAAVIPMIDQVGGAPDVDAPA
jgi:uncharacterized protein with HEPN domain